MCFSLCFRVGFSCSFPLRVHLFSLSLLIMFVKVVRLMWLWLLTYSESLGVRVVNVGVILVGSVWSLFHRDYSLTLDRGVIVGDSVWSFWIGLIGSQGIGCDLWSRWVGDLLIELSWIVIGDSWFGLGGCLVIMWLYCHELDWGWDGWGWFVFNWLTRMVKLEWWKFMW